MFEIDEVTYYKTQDGEFFKTYEEAEEHNKALIEKETLDAKELKELVAEGNVTNPKGIYEDDDNDDDDNDDTTTPLVNLLKDEEKAVVAEEAEEEEEETILAPEPKLNTVTKE